MFASELFAMCVLMHTLPAAGGLLDQNWILMRQFGILKQVQVDKDKFEAENERQRRAARGQ